MSGPNRRRLGSAHTRCDAPNAISPLTDQIATCPGTPPPRRIAYPRPYRPAPPPRRHSRLGLGGLQVRLDGLVLRIEVGHVHHQVLHHVHVGQRRHAADLGRVPVNLCSRRGGAEGRVGAWGRAVGGGLETCD